jgi:peroxiredoxin Q/BCP
MSSTPEAGQQAPDFSLPDGSGRTVKLSDYRGKKVVLYFYPKSFTGGCTAQACSLRDGYADLGNVNAEVIGISVDDEDTQKRFQAENNLPFPVLADAKGEVATLYGVLKDSGVARRITFVIDESGNVTHVFDPAGTEGHAAEVAAVLG